MPAVCVGKEVAGGMVQPWKSCPSDSDLSDRGSVQKSMKAQSFLRYMGSLVCLEPEVVPENLQRSLLTFIILGCTESHGPLISH